MDREQLLDDLDALKRRASDHRLSVTAAVLALEGAPLPDPVPELLNALVLQANTLDLVAAQLAVIALTLRDEVADLGVRLESLELEIWDDGEADTLAINGEP